MIQGVEHHPLESAFVALLVNGLDGTGEALRILANEAARIERACFLKARLHERTPERTDQRIQAKDRHDPAGRTDFRGAPGARSGGFYPSVLEKVRAPNGRSINLALAEMSVQGVSTRKVCNILVKLLEPEVSISSTQVSRAAEKLDARLAAARTATGRDALLVSRRMFTIECYYDRLVSNCIIDRY